MSGPGRPLSGGSIVTEAWKMKMSPSCKKNLGEGYSRQLGQQCKSRGATSVLQRIYLLSICHVLDIVTTSEYI